MWFCVDKRKNIFSLLWFCVEKRKKHISLMKNVHFHARNWPGPKTYIRNPSAFWNIFFFPHLRKLFLFILWFIPWKNYWSPGPIWALMGPWRVNWFIRRVIGCRIKTDHRTIDTGPCKTWFVFYIWCWISDILFWLVWCYFHSFCV